MDRSIWKYALPLMMAATFAATATAQQGSSKADCANLNRCEIGSEIRVVLANGRIIRGFLQVVSTDSIAINATKSQESLPRPDIKRVQVKRAGHRGRNTLIGLAIGAGGGLAAGAAVDHATPQGWLDNIGKAALTPIGGIIGTVIGVAIPTGGWREVYRAA
jgi:hypothetical protein